MSPWRSRSSGHGCTPAKCRIRTRGDPRMQSATISFLNKASAAPMTFRVFSRSSGKPLNTVEMHVLAKAYRAAWRSQFIHDPAGVHVIEALDLVIDFGGTERSDRTRLPDDSPFGPTRMRDWG